MWRKMSLWGVMVLPSGFDGGLREALANDPDAAFLAVLHALALKTFYGSYTIDTCLEIEAKSVSLKTAAGAGLNDTALAQSSQQRYGAWSLRLPRQPEGLWDYVIELDGDSRAALFAHCAAATVNALSQSHDHRPRALAHADRLARSPAWTWPSTGRRRSTAISGGSRRRRSWTRFARPRARPRRS